MTKYEPNDDDTPVGEIRRVQSLFWRTQWVIHRCSVGEEIRPGLIIAVAFYESGVEYLVQWGIVNQEWHTEAELDLAEKKE